MKPDEIVPFQYASRPVRTVTGEDGEPWFALNDVCDVLKLSNPTRASKRLAPDEMITTPLETPGGVQSMVLINEPGMYRLVFTSRTEGAEDFKHWIATDVLPAIRRTGQYLTEEAQQEYAEHVVQTDRMLSSISRRAPQVSSSVEALRFALLDEFLIPLAGTPAIRQARSALQRPPAGPA